ncbi:DUF500 and SH3 domain protein [Tothia fuscella]|uniref:DUF500 and SH3 domain protein n=1 Tax=Tothia fuscella TaxID=1048955 RepID=A0A9P4NIY4_9PEZI|nr:DUF500 and SH3 domain protein [Tothia fuscella]
MPFGINNPIPSSAASEVKKAAKILASFVDPNQSFGPDRVIPPNVLSQAKGLAVITVFKAGFLGSGRFGSGIVVARLPDGSWSAPSAIATVGGGFGGQIGFELTDFVFILNDASAVRSFAQAGSLTLGGNVSLAAGPVGRNAEAAGAASLKGVAGIFAYSKTKGLFAGVSLEGSAIIERKDANEKLYNRKVSARALLEGQVPIPLAAQPLMQILNARSFSGVNGSMAGENLYNDNPVYDDAHDDVVWKGRNRAESGFGANEPSANLPQDRTSFYGAPKQTNTWSDNHQRSPSSPSGGNFSRNSTFSNDGFGGKTAPGRPTAPKPQIPQLTGIQQKKEGMRPDQAIAKFTFEGEQSGDLSFKKGEIITILKRTENASDWWTGRVGTREGIFPSNYVETV